MVSLLMLLMAEMAMMMMRRRKRRKNQSEDPTTVGMSLLSEPEVPTESEVGRGYCTLDHLAVTELSNRGFQKMPKFTKMFQD